MITKGSPDGGQELPCYGVRVASSKCLFLISKSSSPSSNNKRIPTLTPLTGYRVVSDSEAPPTGSQVKKEETVIPESRKLPVEES